MTNPDASRDDGFAEHTICVVDDDASVRAALVRFLKSAGFSVCSFASAEEFLELDPQAGISCLVLDVRMKGMSGLDLQATLLKAARHVPIVFISAHADLDAQARAMRAGAIGFLPKPFRTDDLLRCISEALRPPEESAADSS